MTQKEAAVAWACRDRIITGPFPEDTGYVTFDLATGTFTAAGTPCEPDTRVRTTDADEGCDKLIEIAEQELRDASDNLPTRQDDAHLCGRAMTAALEGDTRASMRAILALCHKHHVKHPAYRALGYIGREYREYHGHTAANPDTPEKEARRLAVISIGRMSERCAGSTPLILHYALLRALTDSTLHAVRKNTQ